MMLLHFLVFGLSISFIKKKKTKDPATKGVCRILCTCSFGFLFLYGSLFPFA